MKQVLTDPLNEWILPAFFNEALEKIYLLC